jgi:hypothetical protein
VRSLFDDIDADKNGSLDAGEMHALAQVAIFVVLAVDGDGCYASSKPPRMLLRRCSRESAWTAMASSARTSARRSGWLRSLRS